MHATHIQHAFETLSPESLPTLMALYASDACFKDPFNDVQGVAPIEHIFKHMFHQVQAPQFKVTSVIASQDAVFMAWVFSFGAQHTRSQINGSTHFLLNADGKIIVHRDYWDAAQELYEHVPVLGWVLRRIRRRLSASAAV